MSGKDMEWEEKAWGIVRRISVLLDEFVDLLKHRMDPVDEYYLDKDLDEIIHKLASWIEAVAEAGEEVVEMNEEEGVRESG